MKDVEIIGMIRSYVKKTLVGMGALKGAPCEVQGVVDAGDGTQTLTLQWKDTAGVTHTTDITLPAAIFAVLNPTNGQTLRYNSVSGKFENSNVSFSADLEDLDNVVITSVQDGQVLTYDAANNRWINADGSTVAALSDLTDVTITTAQNGQLLSYNSALNKWVNISLNIDDLGHVSITSATDGQVLTYDAANSVWKNTDLPTITVDSALDTTSENPVQNKVIALTIDQLSASQISYDGTASGLSANKVKGAIDELASEKVDKETGKGLSVNDFTDILKDKLDGIEAGAEVNDIDTVKVNGTALTPDVNKAVNIELALNKLSDVDLTSLADEMILIYDAANNKWYAGTNTGATYTAGEGIEIDQNNVITSKIVLFTGTEAQWNALPLADKIKFTHYATNDDQTGQIDPVPTQNSNNLMTSGGIYTALQAKADATALADYQTKNLSAAITVDGTQETTVEGAVGAINTLAAGNKTAIGNIKDGSTIDSFGDVETALGNKADKVSGATSGNLAGLDANGNLTDSGSKASDFASATTVANIQAVIPSNVSQSNKLLAAASEVTPTFTAVKTSSTVDFPIILNETANENYKGIKVTMGDVQKYLMTFKSNHLYLTSYDSDGTTKIVDDVQLDPVNTITSGSRTAVTSGAVYSAINDFTSGSTNVTNVNWVKIGRVVILSAKGHNNSGSSPLQENITGAPTPLNGTYELAVTMHADPTNGVAGYIQVQNTAITIKTNANMNAYGSLVYFSAS